jgi:predicted SAM-dependent methyltransferase
MLTGPVPGSFDAAYALDVLEHIDPADEGRFLANITTSLVAPGVLIIGMPSLESQPYASAASKAGHVNCKTAPDLKVLMQKYFHDVFMFSMNDEVVHTGYHKLAHYLFALGVGKRG